MTIAVRIQHHPSRAALATRVLEQLAPDFADISVVADVHEPDRLDAWRSHRACLEAMPAEAEHLLVLQDDALPCQQFASTVLAAIERHPESILLAFVPGFGHLTKTLTDAKRYGASFVPFRVGAFVPTVAIAYPRAVVDGLLAWSDHGIGRTRRAMRGADDGIVAHYCRLRRIVPLAMVPCACDHDATVMSVGKMHPRPGRHRRAALL